MSDDEKKPPRMLEFSDITDKQWESLNMLNLEFQQKVYDDIENILGVEMEEVNIGCLVPFVLAGLVASCAYNSNQVDMFMQLFNGRFTHIIKGFNNEEGGCEVHMVDPTNTTTH